MKNDITHLRSLKNSDYEIKDGEPNIIGWEVLSETGAYIGKTTDLIFEPQTNAVRYLVVDLTGNGMHLDGKSILIPIGIAALHSKNDQVTLPNLHLDQFGAMPTYREEDFGPEMEVQVREVIGSPAALRIETKIVAYNLQNFYAHAHFDRTNFYNRDRAVEQHTIHELVANAKAKDLQADENQPTTVSQHHDNERDDEDNEKFTPGHHQIKPWLEPGASHHQGRNNENSD